MFSQIKSTLWKFVIQVIDLLANPFVWLSAVMFLYMRKIGIVKFPNTKKVLMLVGVFPIINYYYEPWFGATKLPNPLSKPRILPGIDWNIAEQLEIIRGFGSHRELKNIPQSKTDKLEFYFGNGSFESGDAEYWYNIIRSKRPSKIIEIGSGNSTLMARRAIEQNMKDDPNYKCKHVCIEPYEMSWLEKLGIKVLRKKVEEVPLSYFKRLGRDDILFIDSSHMIRPQGDVLTEYLSILPSLKKGVIVHVHDIFTPRDYPKEWLLYDVKFWNEQYLLEAFLTSNHDWKIIGALNYLHHNYGSKLRSKCPYLTTSREPGSFYIQKIK